MNQKRDLELEVGVNVMSWVIARGIWTSRDCACVHRTNSAVRLGTKKPNMIQMLAGISGRSHMGHVRVLAFLKEEGKTSIPT